MKRTLLSLLCFLFFFSAYSTEVTDSSTSEAAEPITALTALAERARAFGERIPQEKVYVHMDNTCYFLGDTIWFAAYTRRTDSGKPSKVSRVLYAELWNHDGFLVERKLVEMKEGRGHGFFELPDTLYSGYFELRAYTRWQLNWGQTEHPHSRFTEKEFYSKAMAKEYFRDYEKLYSRVFPVYDKPREEGVFARDMTLRPLRRQFRNDPKTSPLKLSLFPEGGNVTEDLPCRMAFEAATEEGEACEGTLQLKDGTRIVATAQTENRGRGTFSFTPEKGKKYEAVFTARGGQERDSIIKERIKDIQADGVSLHTEHIGDAWQFAIRSTVERTLGVTVMHEGVTKYFETVACQARTSDSEGAGLCLSVPDTLLPAGVNQVTVFDGDGRIWADRLFFVMRPELTRSPLVVEGMKDVYDPFEEIALTLRLGQRDTVSGGFSLAVRDALRQDRTYDTGNIMTEMLLASEIKGFVPQPEWFFEADDEEHRRGLDLLMLTQGWRRFNWRDMAVQGAWDITHPAEQTQILTGTVNKYLLPGDPIFGVEAGDIPDGRKGMTYGEIVTKEMRERHYEDWGNLKREVRVHAEFVKPDAPKGSEWGVVGEAETEQGRFRIDLPRYYGKCVFFITAKDTTLWTKKLRKLWLKKYQQKSWIQMEDDEYERVHEDAEFYVRLNFPYPRWCKPYTYYQMQEIEVMDTSAVDNVTDGDARLMNEFIVSKRRRNRRNRMDLSKPVYVIDAYEAGNAAMDAGLLTSLGVGAMELAGRVGRTYVGDMGLDRQYDHSLYFDSIKVYEERPSLRPGENETYYMDFPLAYNDYIWRNETISPLDRGRYGRLEYLDKIYIYSDYSPRWEGDERFTQDNQPSVDVSLHKYPNWERRVTYRDRRYVLPGFAYQEDFYHPDYKRNPPREGQKDYRRTLYWNPDLQLDASGEAKVTLYNSSRRTSVNVQTAGQTENGGFLYNSSCF